MSKNSHTTRLPDGDEVTIYLANFLDSELRHLLNRESHKYGFTNEDIVAELRLRGRADLIPQEKEAERRTD